MLIYAHSIYTFLFPMIFHAPIEKFRSFVKEHERHITGLAFLSGFILDALTLRRVDLWIENIIFLVYLTVITASIVLYHAYDGGRFAEQKSARHASWLPIIMQFCFGALMSGFFVFYSRSASLARSWPFLLLLLGLLVGNEAFRGRYARIVFQVSVFFFIVFSYAILILPVILHTIGARVFMLSGLLALAISWIVIQALHVVAPARYRGSRAGMLKSIAVIYVFFNLFYFSNILPPVPLALKDIGLYHSIERTASGNYTVREESVRWYEFARRLRPTITIAPGDSVFIFSSVFAPIRIVTPITHLWSYYDELQNKWIPVTRIEFTIAGGADTGYRGYSKKSSVWPGRWRVDVLTDRGQLIGRLNFQIIEGNPGSLREKVL